MYCRGRCPYWADTMIAPGTFDARKPKREDVDSGCRANVRFENGSKSVWEDGASYRRRTPSASRQKKPWRSGGNDGRTDIGRRRRAKGQKGRRGSAWPDLSPYFNEHGQSVRPESPFNQICFSAVTRDPPYRKIRNDYYGTTVTTIIWPECRCVLVPGAR